MPGHVELLDRGLQSIASRASYAFQRAQRSSRPGPPILAGLFAEICAIPRAICPDWEPRSIGCSQFSQLSCSHVSPDLYLRAGRLHTNSPHPGRAAGAPGCASGQYRRHPDHPKEVSSYTGHQSHPRTVSAFMSSRSVHARLPSSLATAMQWFAEKASLCVIVVPRVPGSRSVRGPCGRLHVHRHRSWLMWPCRPFSDQESVAGESAC